jgi:hypothetical protein
VPKNNIFASFLKTAEDLSEEARKIREIDTELGREVRKDEPLDDSGERDGKLDDAIEELDGVIREAPDLKEDQKKTFNQKMLDLVDRL